MCGREGGAQVRPGRARAVRAREKDVWPGGPSLPRYPGLPSEIAWPGDALNSHTLGAPPQGSPKTLLLQSTPPVCVCWALHALLEPVPLEMQYL